MQRVSLTQKATKMEKKSVVSAPEGNGTVTTAAKREGEEQTLREQLDLTEAILQTTSALVVVLDPQGGIVQFNHACERSTGYSFGEVRGRRVWDMLLTPDEVEGVKAVFANLRAGQFPNTHENYWVAKDGARRLIAWSNTAVLDHTGAVRYVIGTGIDITERRQAEKALAQSETRYRDLARFPAENPDPVLRVRNDGTVLFANDASLPLLDAWRCRVGKSVPESLATTIVCALASGRRAEIEVPVNGRTFAVSLAPVVEAGYVNLYGRDVTERKRAAQRLQEAHETLERRVRQRTAELEATTKRLQEEIEERKRMEESLAASVREWQDTFDASNDAVCLLNVDRQILRCNRAMTTLTESTVAEIVDRPCYEVVHGTDRPGHDCLMGRLMKTRRREEKTIQQGDKWFRAIVDPLLDDSGNLIGAVHTMSDITEQKHLKKLTEMAEQELEEQRVLQMHTDRLRSLGEMAAGIAHELNQPLVGVRGLAEHLLLGMERGWDLPPEKVREKLSLVVEQADRMTHIIEHVRTFAREAGKPDRCPTQVNDVIRSAISMLGAQLQSHGITLATELDSDLPAVLANPFSLEEVVLNLISNARDAVEQRMETAKPAPNEQPDILLRTQVLRSGEGEFLELQIIDSGDGVPEEVIERVFEPFFTTKPPGQGTGLGLSICKSIVEQFDGTIEITSDPGKETTVTVSLPANGGGDMRNSKQPGSAGFTAEGGY